MEGFEHNISSEKTLCRQLKMGIVQILNLFLFGSLGFRSLGLYVLMFSRNFADFDMEKVLIPMFLRKQTTSLLLHKISTSYCTEFFFHQFPGLSIARSFVLQIPAVVPFSLLSKTTEDIWNARCSAVDSQVQHFFICQSIYEYPRRADL